MAAPERGPIPYTFEDAPKEAHIEFSLPPSVLKAFPSTPSTSDFDIDLSHTTVRIALKGDSVIIEVRNFLISLWWFGFFLRLFVTLL
jgi:hypothetical protein